MQNGIFSTIFFTNAKIVALVARTKLKRGTTAYDVPLFKAVVKCSIKPASMSEFHDTKIVHDVCRIPVVFIKFLSTGEIILLH